MPRALRIRPALKISCSTNVVVNVMVHGPGRPEIKTPLPTVTVPKPFYVVPTPSPGSHCSCTFM